MAKAFEEEIVGDEKAAPKKGSKRIHLVVVTPEKAVLDALVDFVAVPLFDGEAGFLPGRSPLIGRLGYGELRTRSADQLERYFVDGGFVQVRDNAVTILTPRAIPAREIDVNAAMESQKALEASRPTSLFEAGERDKGMARARGMIRMASKR